MGVPPNNQQSNRDENEDSLLFFGSLFGYGSIPIDTFLVG